MNVARSGIVPTSGDSLRIKESLEGSAEEHTRFARFGFYVLDPRLS
jgi:hypothetical protein